MSSYKSIRKRTSNTNLQNFENFFKEWLTRQQYYLEELQATLLQTTDESSAGDVNVDDLITRVLGHYQQYYEEKSRIANYDVSLVFSPPWFSSFEKSFFWIGGFKPGLAFRMVTRSVDDMTQKQAEAMEQLREETTMEEREVEKEMAKIQEGIAGHPIVKATRGNISIQDGKYDIMGVAIEALRVEMEDVLGIADILRSRTVERLVEILTPLQNVKFLAAVTELFIKIRILGWQIEADSQI